MMQKIEAPKTYEIDQKVISEAVQEYAKQEFLYKIHLLEKRLIEKGFTDALDNNGRLKPEKIHAGFNSKGEHVFSYIHGIGMYEEVIVFYNEIKTPKSYSYVDTFTISSTLKHR